LATDEQRSVTVDEYAAATSVGPNQPSSAGWLRHRPYRSLYVPEITLRLRKGVDRETSAVTVNGGPWGAGLYVLPRIAVPICALDQVAERLAAQVLVGSHTPVPS
jgi:hypothetical protein